MVRIREAREEDAPEIREIYIQSYGDEYPYSHVYDLFGLKKVIFSDDTLILVAVDEESDRVVGTASVILEIGAYTDLVGEFGRLAVLPEARHQGIGRLLLQRRLEIVRDRLHVGLMEARVTHPFTQIIAQKEGFAPVGFLPMKLAFGERRESIGLLVRYFGNALGLRRNHPHIIPEVYQLAGAAMDSVGLEMDTVVDERTPSYPHGGGYSVQELTTEGYASLLRIERGRVRKREIFGPLRLHYGFFKLISNRSTYLIARDGDRIVGAIGFTIEEAELNVRVFELISLEDHVIRFLLEELVRRSQTDWSARYVEIDVNADSPGMQRTLLELGFVPVAYVPALAFHRFERRDVVKMARLLTGVDISDTDLIGPTRKVASIALRGFARCEVLPRVAEVVDRVGLFAGLADEQTQRLASACSHVSFRTSEKIFLQGDECVDMHIVLEGAVRIEVDGRAVGTVGPGECLGEIALLSGTRHSATAIAETDCDCGLMTGQSISELVRLRPDIGVVLYRNLGRGLGEKLRRADARQRSRDDSA